MSGLFADVLLPLPLKDLYTYEIPSEYSNALEIGQRVVVQFGKQKIYSALVYRIHNDDPDYKAKEILSVLDSKPIVNHIQFKFWEWLAEYYMCTKGEVMNAALPSALKLASETKIALNPSFDEDYLKLNDREYLITEALEMHKVLYISDIAKIVNQKNVMPLIKSLIEKGVVLAEEQLLEDYKPKMVSYVRLSEEYKNEEKLRELFNVLEKKAYKQLELLMIYLHLSKKDSYNLSTNNEQLSIIIEVRRSEIISMPKASDAALNALVKKGVLQIYQKQISRLELTNNEQQITNNELDGNQINALDSVIENFKHKDVVLLHGITSSGKTEIYVKLINEVISQGKQVLYLVPEIALTTQLIMRLKKFFGNSIAVYHSKFTKDERVEIWNNILEIDNSNFNIQNSKFKIIIGPRSSLFLPFNNLGLIIVDEEHDYSYKQNDVSPRFNARDAAIYLASLHSENKKRFTTYDLQLTTKVLLGSATPSVESYYNAQIDKYGLVELNERFGNIDLPEILVVNIKDEIKNRKMKSHFSSVLLDSIKFALDHKEQIILFQNRRGYSLRLECDQCGWLPHCKNCDVTLTYHKQNNQLLCHYCGYIMHLPDLCPACGSANIKMKGFGTEKIEDELPLFFKDVKTSRMDLDTTRTKNAYHQLIHDFQERRIDILVGTQMVTKGLDFDNVSVVGIMNADNMLTFPDFRTFERSYQQLSQVSGRAGRKNKQGRVIIQTSNPDHQIIKFVVKHDYFGMYKSQMKDRQTFNYPPFSRLIKISLKHKELDVLNDAASHFAKTLKKLFGGRVLGPEFPVIAKIRNYYIKDILIKVEKNSSVSSFKSKIAEKLIYFGMTYKSVKIIIDVDPQ